MRRIEIRPIEVNVSWQDLNYVSIVFVIKISNPNRIFLFLNFDQKSKASKERFHSFFGQNWERKILD